VIDRPDSIVIGAGMSGLAAADALHREGRTVAIVEASDAVGGLARSIIVGGEPIEPYYHHIFPQDHETRDLIDQLGLSGQLEWRTGPMAVMHHRRTFPFDSPLDVLRFSPLSVLERIRLAAATGVQLFRPDRAHLDRTPVSIDGPRWFGRRGYETLWRPLLEAKFGEHADTIAMAWLVARIRQRGGARKATGDRLGYLRGSLGALAEACTLIRRMWTEDDLFDFGGRHYQLRGAACEPKPVQRPHPPFVIGAGGERSALRVVAEQADIWNCPSRTAAEFRHKSRVLDEHCAAIGRDPAEITRSIPVLVPPGTRRRPAPCSSS